MVDVYHLELTRADLDSVPVDERELYVLGGHFANDLAILNKQALYALNDGSDPVSPKARYGTAIGMLNIRLLIVRLWAAWEVLQQAKYQSLFEVAADALETDPESTLEEIDIRAAIAVLFEELGPDAVLTKVRRKAGAHTDRATMMRAYGELPSDHAFLDLLALARGNTLYGAGEEVMTLAVLSATGEEDVDVALGKIADKAIRASGAFADLIQGWFLHFMATRFRDRARMAVMLKHSISAPRLDEVRLPFLTEPPAAERV